MKLAKFNRGILALSLGMAGVPLAYGQTYFEWLISQPEHHDSTDLGSPAEVINNVHFSDKSKATTEYDASMDAAKFTIPAGQDDIATGDQVRYRFPYVDSGNLLVYWESYAPSYWAKNGSVDGVSTYKAFQLSHDGDLTLEFRYRFSQVDTPYVARVDTRVYGSKSGVQTDGNKIAPQVGEFNIRPETWTKFWAFLDFDNNRFSYWVGDENREPVLILDYVPFDWQQNYGPQYGFNEFWFEFNTSQDRPSGPETYMYGRNLAILRNVSDVESVIARNETGNEDVSTRPSAPVLNSVE